MATQTQNDYGAWGLLGADDQKICDYEGILEVSNSSTSQVLTEPIENGQLAAFNKVQQPDNVRVVLSLGSDPTKQRASLTRLKQFKGGTGTDFLCKLISPSEVSENLSLESIGQTRTSQSGATLLTVELTFVQIRVVQVVSQQFAWSPKNPTGDDPVNSGRVQAERSSNLDALAPVLGG